MLTGRTDYLHRYEADSAFTPDYEGSYYHEPWVSYTIENKEVHYNKRKTMTVPELLENGYADIIQDRSKYHPGSETSYEVIQIHPNCPVRLENITDFDDYLTSATTFVWREDLPDKWSPEALAAKYDAVELARPFMVELFRGVDMSGVDSVNLSFNGGVTWNSIHTSIVTERFTSDVELNNKSPKEVTVTFRNFYSSIFQTVFSQLGTTTALTINVPQSVSCHDVTGIFEGDVNLETITINGNFGYDGWRTCHNAFNWCNNLKRIPSSTYFDTSQPYGRDDELDAEKNTIFPRNDGVRGSANCHRLFNAPALEYIGPRFNMGAINLIPGGCIFDGYPQDQLNSGVSEDYMLFYCPELTDVRIINLNNNDWNFADSSTKTYIPKMDVTSIEYLLNHAYDCSADPHTVTFSDLHENEVSAAAIQAANAKGWTVAWQPAD